MFSVKIYNTAETQSMYAKAEKFIPRFKIAQLAEPEVFKHTSAISTCSRGKEAQGKVMLNNDGTWGTMRHSTNRSVPNKGCFVPGKHKFADQLTAERAIRVLLAFDQAEKEVLTVTEYNRRKLLDATSFAINLEDHVINELLAGKWDELFDGVDKK